MQRRLRQQFASSVRAELAHHVKAIGEIHRRHGLPDAKRQVGAGERGVVRAHPAAQRDLRGEQRPARAPPACAWRALRRSAHACKRVKANQTRRARIVMPPSRCAVTITGLSSSVTVHMPSAA